MYYYTPILYMFIGACIFFTGAFFMHYVSNYSKISNSSDDDIQQDIPFYCSTIEKEDKKEDRKKKPIEEDDEEEKSFYN